MKIAKLFQETYTPRNNLEKYELIQILRFIAALAVVLCHSAFYAQERLDPYSFRYGPGIMAYLFFLLSVVLL